MTAGNQTETLAWGAWGLTAVGVVAAGLLLWAARGSIAPALDRWLPAAEEAPAEPEPAPVAAAVEPREPAAPVWTFDDLAAALEPLPGLTAALVAEGRAELPEFAGLDSADEVRARLVANRWRSWGRIWHNRVGLIRRRLPPPEPCRIHAALGPTCDALDRSLAVLDRVPAAERIEDARDLLDRAAAVLEELRRWREETDEPVAEEDGAGEDGAGEPGSR